MPRGVKRRLVREIAGALRGAALKTGHFTFYRTVLAGRDPIDPSRSRFYVGRWHDPCTFLAIYVSEDARSSMAEMRAHLRAGRHLLEVFTLDVEVGALLDLTDPAIAVRLPFPLRRCLVRSQIALFRGAAVGAAAFSLGATAIRAPCVRTRKACGCLFFDLNQRPLNSIEAVTLAERRAIAIR